MLWRWFNSLAFRLTALVALVVAIVLAVVVGLQLAIQQRLSRQQAELAGLALTEGLFGALHSSMLANDREQLRRSVASISRHAPGLRVRIMTKEGRIAYSSRPGEVGGRLNFAAEACYKCHKREQPISHLPPGERTRSFEREGRPTLGIIRPIANEAGCVARGCHPSVESKPLLGVLDTTIRLEGLGRARRDSQQLLAVATLAAFFVIIALVTVVVRRTVGLPIQRLSTTVDAIGAGDLGARYEEQHSAELARLGAAVNHMAQELEQANAKLTEWATTLERRVEQKSAELQQAQQRVLRVERMASLGKLAAVVAHEINNPLASVLTYSRLLKRRMEQQPECVAAIADSPEILDAIANESRRCGEIVSSLLAFARGTGRRQGPADANDAVQRALFLVKHKLELAGVTSELALSEEPLHLSCNGDQLQQALLALFLNAVEAMGPGGVLRVATRLDAQGQVVIEVGDTGSGIAAEALAHVFEPFFSTKSPEEGVGLGLGLTVVESIVHENEGVVRIESEPGAGTCFSLIFPRYAPGAPALACRATGPNALKRGDDGADEPA